MKQLNLFSANIPGFVEIKLTLVRHGYSEANADKSLYHSKPDHTVDLNTLGENQAKELANSFKGISPDKTLILHSPFLRAKRTAEIFTENLEQKGFILQEDPLIHEMFLIHSLEEMNHAELFECEERKEFSPFWYKKGTSESFYNTYLRARTFYQDILLNTYNLKENDNLFVFSHGIFLQCLIGVIEKQNVSGILKQGHLKNCEHRTYPVQILG